MKDDSIFGDADLIHAYTRADALRDGQLVDVSEIASEAGFKVPVALTAALHADVNDLSGKYVTAGQVAEGRLWDLLWLARLGATSPEYAHSSEFLFELHMPVGEFSRYSAKCVIGPGDDESPVITLTQPHED